jgi:hypothetical protein
MPPFVTVRETRGVNVAVTVVSAASVTLQLPVPVQAPPHPLKRLPTSGVAVSVTLVPGANHAVHVEPHAMPLGVLLTVPALAVPALVTSSETSATNVAVTALSATAVTVHGPGPVQAPLHPVNMAPASAVAVRVTGVLRGKLAAQVPRQVSPGGPLVTVPVPLPATVTVNVTIGA